MENRNLQKRANNIKTENESVIDDLISEIEELEETVKSQQEKIYELEARLSELK